MKFLLFILLFFFTSIIVFSQKKVFIENKDDIVKEAIHEIEVSMQPPEGDLYLFTQKYKITGTYDFDITLYEKGLVATVFVNNREGGSILSQNKLKDFVKAMKFEFKMPKGKKYKFNYVFNFN